MENNLEQLETDFREQSGKLLIMKSAVGSTRKVLERRFELEAGSFFHVWYGQLAQKMEKTGVLRRAAQQAQTINSTLVSVEQRNKLVDISATKLCSTLLPLMKKKPEWKDFKETWKSNLVMGFNYGAVTALRSMGYSPKLSNERTKAAGGVEFGLTDEELLNSLFSRTVEFGDGIIGGTIEDVRKILAETVYRGKTIEEAVEKITEAKDIPAWRAMKISRTEIQSAINTAMSEMYSRSGVQRKKWITVGDKRVREQHKINESEGYIQMDERFSSGQLHPGDGVLSANCRCSMQADLNDPKLKLVPWDGSGK